MFRWHRLWYGVSPMPPFWELHFARFNVFVPNASNLYDHLDHRVTRSDGMRNRLTKQVFGICLIPTNLWICCIARTNFPVHYTSPSLRYPNTFEIRLFDALRDILLNPLVFVGSVVAYWMTELDKPNSIRMARRL